MKEATVKTVDREHHLQIADTREGEERDTPGQEAEICLMSDQEVIASHPAEVDKQEGQTHQREMIERQDVQRVEIVDQ